MRRESQAYILLRIWVVIVIMKKKKKKWVSLKMYLFKKKEENIIFINSNQITFLSMYISRK